MIFALARALTYAALFVGLLLVFVPARLLGPAGFETVRASGAVAFVGVGLAAAGALLALACVVTFAVLGRGTPAPFDPPRRLVVRGPYALVRNPMYLGAGLALAGAALVYASLPLLAYAVGFLAAAHALVLLTEEPTLRRDFGSDYAVYCRAVGRWWPHFR